MGNWRGKEELDGDHEMMHVQQHCWLKLHVSFSTKTVHIQLYVRWGNWCVSLSCLNHFLRKKQWGNSFNISPQVKTCRNYPVSYENIECIRTSVSQITYNAFQLEGPIKGVYNTFLALLLFFSHHHTILCIQTCFELKNVIKDFFQHVYALFSRNTKP